MTIWKLKPIDKIRDAIAKGAHSREEIQKATRLGMDEVCDLLAELRFEIGALQTRVIDGERRFYAA